MGKGNPLLFSSGKLISNLFHCGFLVWGLGFFVLAGRMEDGNQGECAPSIGQSEEI